MIRSSQRAALKALRASVPALIFCLAAPAAFAGPPYITDDPVPTDTGHWEIYSFTDNSRFHGEHAGQAGLDINYGLVKDVQLTTTIAGQYANGDDHGLQFADTEIGFKYRFVNAKEAALQVSFFPKLILPTAPGGGRVAYELPVWFQKDAGKWSLFGGGGVTLRTGAGARNSWEQGLALTRQVSDTVSLGIEAAHEGAEAKGERGATTLQLGTNIHIVGPLSLLAAAGPVIEDHGGRTGAHLYASILTAF